MQQLLNYIWQHQDTIIGALGAIVAGLIVPLIAGFLVLIRLRYRPSKLRARRHQTYAEGQQRKEEQARRIKAERQLTQLSLFAIARTTLEADDRAIVGKTYIVEAGVSQNRPEDFRGEPFTVSVQNPFEPLSFGILLHPSENIELIGALSIHSILLLGQKNSGNQEQEVCSPQTFEYQTGLLHPLARCSIIIGSQACQLVKPC